MLRSKSGHVRFKVVDKTSGKEEWGNIRDHLTNKQRVKVATMPDMTWQFAQYLKDLYLQKGKEVEVYAFTEVSLNGSADFQLIDPTVNLADVPWDYFQHSKWIRNP
ncbi:MAG: HTTM domain-containing protein [Proteobacteria bacterium]|nr:HTTM domain-containing protein [Pseudomonadota bacterium]